VIKPFVCAIVSLTCIKKFLVTTSSSSGCVTCLWNLHQFLHDISSENVIENDLKKLIGDDGQFQFIAMPNENLWLVNGGHWNLEVVVRADAKVFGRIKKLIRKDNMQCFAVLRNDKPAGDMK